MIDQNSSNFKNKLWGVYFGIGFLEGLAILYHVSRNDTVSDSLKYLYPILIFLLFWGLLSLLVFFDKRVAEKLTLFFTVFSRRLIIILCSFHLFFLTVTSIIFFTNQFKIPISGLLLFFLWSIWAAAKYLLLYSHSVESVENTKSRKTIELFLLLCIFLIIVFFWAYLKSAFLTDKSFIPVYTGELFAIKNINLINIWTWIDCGSWDRYSPTGIFFIGLLDRHIFSPLLNIDFLSENFINATRFVYFYIFTFGFMSVLIYKVSRSLELNIIPSFVVALFFGLHKGLSYSFRYMTIVATCLMLIYGCFVILAWMKYLKSRKKTLLIPFYLSFLLLIGSWEQWVNFFIFFVLFSVILLLLKKYNSKAILFHGILIPIVLFSIYIGLRYPSMNAESSRLSEAQYVFSYPSASLMAEDMISNISLNISSIIEPLLFPWPMVSQSTIESTNILEYNQYDSQWANPLIVGAHYRNFTDWYAGLLLGLFISLTIFLLYHLYKHKFDSLVLLIGLLLTWTGFFAHIPIMYRVIFVTPQSAGMLGYKHFFSILGFALIVGWLFMKMTSHPKIKQMLPFFCFILCDWILFCNFSKIMISSNLLMNFLW